MYEDQTYETILERMLDRVPDKFDKREGSGIPIPQQRLNFKLCTLSLTA